MNEVKRIRCINKQTGRVRFIIETLCTPRWLERHGLVIEEIEKPTTDATKKGKESKDDSVKHQEVDARGIQAETSGSNIVEPSEEEAKEVDPFADFAPKKTRKSKTN